MPTHAFPALQQIARAHINAKELDKAVETLERP
jgi:hypothetical protein